MEPMKRKYRGADILLSATEKMRKVLESPYNPFPEDAEKEYINCSITIVKSIKLLLKELLKCEDDIDRFNCAKLCTEFGELRLAKDLFLISVEESLDDMSETEAEIFYHFVREFPSVDSDVRHQLVNSFKELVGSAYPRFAAFE
jgi:hypothetical protein